MSKFAAAPVATGVNFRKLAVPSNCSLVYAAKFKPG